MQEKISNVCLRLIKGNYKLPYNMLITFEDIYRVLLFKNIKVNGAFHVGAHECEELPFYDRLGISFDNIVWVDAIPSKVEQAITRGVPNVYNAVMTDKDDEEVEFHISNNGQSSSVLELGTHLQEHPHVFYIDKLNLKTITIDTFFERNKLDASKYDFWNFDIQGAELMALKGAIQSIRHAKVIYLEVNEKELYKGCGLLPEIDAFLDTYHFKRVLTYMTQYGWGDALYILDA
jgi:FkbM family methyltransferase